jgi:hypothetical protein
MCGRSNPHHRPAWKLPPDAQPRLFVQLHDAVGNSIMPPEISSKNDSHTKVIVISKRV